MSLCLYAVLPFVAVALFVVAALTMLAWGKNAKPEGRQVTALLSRCLFLKTRAYQA